MSKQYRQGDVFVQKVAEMPKGGTKVKRDNGRVVLAYGEVTGHAHAIASKAATLYALPDTQDRWLEVEEAVTLRHEEHASITLEPGLYRVRQQREYVAPAINRFVGD